MNTAQQNTYKKLDKAINEYIESVRKELEERWNAWHIDMSKIEKHEVIGALLARQITLATQLISAPSIWNGHIAPLILRTMVDNYINLAWIFNKNSLGRAKKFIEYGLGQQKLVIEHRKEELRERGIKDVDNELSIKMFEDWINSQRYTFLTTVDIGNWTGKNTRTMAKEADCLDFYRLAYTPFSSNTHNMWNHVSRYNLRVCKNPIHRMHKIPIDPDMYIDMDYPYRAAKYVAKAFALFDKKTSIKIKSKSSLVQFEKNLDKLTGLNK